MKPVLKFVVLVLLTGMLFYTSCKKEKTTAAVINPPIPQSNRPPIANAGQDQTITLPTNSVNLDGSGSADPDSNITSYGWTKISGPSSFHMGNTSTVQTQVTNLVQGVYQMELKVTDAGGLFSRDTMQVMVNNQFTSCNITQTLIGNLSIPRYNVRICAVGNKILFVGGQTTPGQSSINNISSRVDIYDIVSNTWVTAELSEARYGMGIIASGNKIFFGGGQLGDGSLSTRVDIYDASKNTWATTELNESRQSLVAVATGNKVLFAGGYVKGGMSDQVDIYDQSNGTWSEAALSHPISIDHTYSDFNLSGVVSAGNKIYFITSSNNIDIYDAQTNTWSTHTVSPNQLAQKGAVLFDNKIYFSGSTPGSVMDGYVFANTLEIYDISSDNWSSVKMSQSRAYMSATAGDGKIFWAGGFDSSWTQVGGEQAIRVLNNIEIYDVNTGLHSFHDLQPPEWFVKAFKTDNKIFFSYGNYTEAYDINNHSWTICNNFQFQPLAGGNINYQVGADNLQVWKLDF